MRTCSRNSPMVCRGRRDGSSRGLLRRNRLSFKHVHDWGTNRSVICSPASLVPSPVRTRPVPGLAVDGWSRSTEPGRRARHARECRLFWAAARKSRRAVRQFPQARLVAVAECGTHAIFDAVLGPCRTSEIEMARALAGRLEPGMLVLADRGLYGFELWSQAAGTGADLLWRVKTTLRPRHVQTLPDGSWLARIVATSGAHRASTPPLNVRVVDYTIDDGRDNPEQYRLLTTILDPTRPARPNSPVLTRSVGKSRASSTNSNRISADLGRCCARSPRSWYSRRCGDTYAAITPSGRSCSTPRRTPGTTPIEYPSSRRCVSPEDRCPTALFPPT